MYTEIVYLYIFCFKMEEETAIQKKTDKRICYNSISVDMCELFTSILHPLDFF